MITYQFLCPTASFALLATFLCRFFFSPPPLPLAVSSYTYLCPTLPHECQLELTGHKTADHQKPFFLISWIVSVPQGGQHKPVCLYFQVAYYLGEGAGHRVGTEIFYSDPVSTFE